MTLISKQQLARELLIFFTIILIVALISCGMLAYSFYAWHAPGMHMYFTLENIEANALDWFAIIAFIVYPVRLSYFLIRWSFDTLKNPVD
jgi:hypothetical protein